MNCDRFYELMSAKLDGELSEQEAEALQAHLSACPECSRVYKAMASIEEDVAGLERPAPAGLKQGVLYRIGQETGSVKKSKRRFWGVGTGLGLAAAMLVLMVGVGVIRMPKHKAKDAAAQAPRLEDADPYEIDPDSLEDMRGGETQLLPNGHASTSKYGQITDGNWFGDDTAEDLPEATRGGMDILPMPAEPDRHNAPQEDDAFAEEPWFTVPAATDFYYEEGGRPGADDEDRLPERPVTEELTKTCQSLSTENGAPVLLYTEFPRETVFSLLEKAEPELYACLEKTELQQVGETEAGTLYACAVEYQTALALQEWLVENLPRSQVMDEATLEAEASLIIRMEELDPESGSLYRIITWAPRQQAIEWPAVWPKGWAIRFRTGENWALFFPSEDNAPESGDTAYLVFLAP